jgi:Kef-type K+ transport system membrane component KefB
VLFSVLGTAAFLAFCFTIGRRWVARIIRWTNDHSVIEMPVITMILVIMIALAVVTKFIGVHTCSVRSWRYHDRAIANSDQAH